MILLHHFTHYAVFYGIPCYWNEETQELAGRNWFFDILIVLLSSLHNVLIAPFNDSGFPISIGGEIEREVVRRDNEVL